ncbi:MAG: tRNA (uridine(34)/cytosine(34)/5-carboxymethylaminomethyluridine(34)-2'-O)-methyltransferase TrmL [Sphaerochaetaceae bacterium]|nr:tRNA (uridine(34)/cytosine(34)/5-carboxymethylaminomethyluridine(34)-2'-O)-methyltransferase TrmL [Sphaerochaetaceae bacterium]
MSLHIVLFEPEIPQNTGNIARTCAALGAELHLVHPLGFSISEKQVRRAGLDYWKDVRIHEHESIRSFLRMHSERNLWFFTTKAHQLFSNVQFEEDAFLIFGKESRGIEESILVDYPERCVRVPMLAHTRSLNLSNSVAVAAYEWERQHEYTNLRISGDLHRLSWQVPSQEVEVQ